MKKLLTFDHLLLTAAFLAAALFGPGIADAAPESDSHRIVHHVVVHFTGNDQESWSPLFKVGAHWKVTCSAAKVGNDFGVQIFAVPDAGAHNLEVVNMTNEGVASEYVRDSGTWRLHVIGFAAAFDVTVEEAD